MEKYLRKCLDSLIVSDENMERLEVLVINDGSKDSSSQIAHEYESKYPQTFRVINKENGNYGSCINRGLKEATGKYVKVLDADDYYVNDVFNSYVSYLQNVDVDLVINDFRIVDENDKETETYTFDLPLDREFTLSDIPREMIVWLWHQTITYKREIPLSINYKQTEGISYTDDEWVFEPMVGVQSILYFPYIMYNYLLGREGQTFAPQVMKASFDKRVIVGMSMIKFYSGIQDTCSPEAKYFMSEKLTGRLSPIYKFYLIKQYSQEGNSQLKDLDLCLKKYTTDIYRNFDKKKNRFGGEFYITAWRHRGYKITMLQRIRQLKFKIHLLLGGEFRKMHMPDNLRRI